MFVNLPVALALALSVSLPRTSDPSADCLMAIAVEKSDLRIEKAKTEACRIEYRALLAATSSVAIRAIPDVPDAPEPSYVGHALVGGLAFALGLVIGGGFVWVATK